MQISSLSLLCMHSRSLGLFQNQNLSAAVDAVVTVPAAAAVASATDVTSTEASLCSLPLYFSTPVVFSF